jgi:hypothetical protein
MKYNILPNPNRNTITVILTPVTLPFTDYLFKKYKEEKFFASGIIKGADYKTDLVPFLTEVSKALTAVGKDILPTGTQINTQDLISLGEEYRLITRNLDKEGNWDKQFKINLTNRSKDGEKRFLFLDLEQTKPISKEESWKHNYAIELEIGVGFDEKKNNKYVYAIFHRAISTGLRETNTFQKNDNAWKGFNLDKIAVDDDKLPF